MVHSIFSFRTLAYFAYAVLLTAVLLYVRFPAEKFRAYCEKRIEHLLTDSTCKIEGIAYRFPLSASFDTIKITRVINGLETSIVIDRLVISPEPLKFWKSFNLKGELYSGKFEARLDVDPQAQSFHLVNIHFEGVEVDALVQAIGLTERKITGILDFSGEYQAQNSHPGDGAGKGVVEISTGSMSLLQPILSLSTLDFEKVAVDVTLEKGLLKIAQGDLQGRDMTADFTGELRIAPQLLDSNLQLSGHMEPDETFLRSNPQEQQIVQRLMQRFKMTVLAFRVGGTVKRPLFRFST